VAFAAQDGGISDRDVAGEVKLYLAQNPAWN